MNENRYGHAAILCEDGRVLVTGGKDETDTIVDTGEVYDVNEDVWIPTANMQDPRYGHKMATLIHGIPALFIPAGSIVILGGEPGDTFDAELYKVTIGAGSAAGMAGGLFNSLNSDLFGRSKFGCVTLSDGRIVIFGGFDSLGATMNQTNIFNPWVAGGIGTEAWTISGDMTVARARHGGVLLHQGTSDKILATGGTTDGTNPITSIDIFNPNTGTWTAGTSFTTATQNHALVALDDGNVLQVGGSTTNGSVYFPTTNSWSNNIADSTVTSGEISGILLDDGNVITGFNGSTVFVPPQTVMSTGRLNDLVQITYVDPNTFTYTLPDSDGSVGIAGILTSYTGSDGSIITAKGYRTAAAEDENHSGPYLFDPTAGPAISGEYTTITQDLVKDQNYSTISVTDASNFPSDGGFLVVGFGTEFQTFPIKYLYVLSDNLLAVDSSFTFPIDIPSGSKIHVLIQKGPWVPENITEVGAFYSTDSITGRMEASNTIDNVVAAGVDIRKTVIYPGTYGLGNGEIDTSAQDVPKVNDALYIWGSEDDVSDARGDD